MNNVFKITLLITASTLSGFTAQSQSVSNQQAPVDADVALAKPLKVDTMHITPAMIDSIKAHPKITQFEPDIESSVFIPKGQWITGVSISYTQSTQNAYQFLILENLSGDTYSFKCSPMLAYAFKNDMAVGVKFSYTRSLTKLQNADFVLGADTQFNVDHLYSLSHNYYGTIIYRNYFGLGSSKRFGFFNEIQLQLGGGQSKITKGVSADLTGAYERNFQLNIGIVPGLMVFLSNWSALEVNVGVLGFSYTDTHTINDQIYHSHRNSKFANFRINLLSITFGTTFYL